MVQDLKFDCYLCDKEFDDADNSVTSLKIINKSCK